MVRGARSEKLGFNRRMVAAASAVNREQNTIHFTTEVDVSVPRAMIADHQARTGERLSLTGYVTACLARTMGEFPQFNVFRKGRKLVLLDDLAISVLVERTMDGEFVPEPIVIQEGEESELHSRIATLIGGTPWPATAHRMQTRNPRSRSTRSFGDTP